jgi:uncharacterized membrane protein
MWRFLNLKYPSIMILIIITIALLPFTDPAWKLHKTLLIINLSLSVSAKMLENILQNQ